MHAHPSFFFRSGLHVKKSSKLSDWGKKFVWVHISMYICLILLSRSIFCYPKSKGKPSHVYIISCWFRQNEFMWCIWLSELWRWSTVLSIQECMDNLSHWFCLQAVMHPLGMKPISPLNHMLVYPMKHTRNTLANCIIWVPVLSTKVSEPWGWSATPSSVFFHTGAHGHAQPLPVSSSDSSSSDLFTVEPISLEG